MADIVNRLRRHADRAVGHWEDYANATDSIVREAADEIERLESLHRSDVADMAERFRSVNVSEAVKQLADILPAAPAEHVEADRLRRMVERRDEFIIGKGLWDQFKEASREAE